MPVDCGVFPSPIEACPLRLLWLHCPQF